MKPVLLLLIVAGLVLGPGYWIQAKFYSGHLAQTLDFKAGEAGRLDSGGFVLSADMRPAGLILKAQGSFAPNMDESQPPADRYLAQVYLDGRPFREVELRLAVKSVSDSNPAFVERLLWLEAVTPGEYRVVLTPRAAPKISLDRVRLEVRAGIREPDGRVVAAGLAMLILGALALFLG